MSTISEQLAEFVSVTNISDQAIAEMVGMSPATINMVRNGAYKSDPVRLRYFFKCGMADELMSVTLELKSGRAKCNLHKRRSELLNIQLPKDIKPSSLLNAKMPKGSNQAASSIN